MDDDLAGPPESLTLETLCSDPAIREAFTDHETSQIFREIEEDPTKIKQYQENVKVQRSLRLIHDTLDRYLTTKPKPRQPLQLPGMMEMFTQFNQMMDSQGNVDRGDFLEQCGILDQLSQSMGSEGKAALKQMFQQGYSGNSPQSLQTPSGTPSCRQSQQLLQQPGMRQMMAKMAQSMSSQGNANGSDIMEQLFQFQGSLSKTENHFGHLIQQATSGVFPQSQQTPSRHPHASSNECAPFKIHKSNRHHFSSKKSRTSNKQPLALPNKTEDYQSDLPPRK
ncbi:uncharacterized protein LOC132560268 [Ylistrum balloti]|uniref:uncharacterized protein LOC132560268 n=1 Tax=Ylistrum balloti TaxID=509963 RepID=UPI002905EBDB|nr:uncharacterized protein LOC132560268 [Ylistrum balloti]